MALPSGKISQVFRELAVELEFAYEKFPDMVSPHEGAAIIQEEWEELWDEIKANQGRTVLAYNEAKQLAAMAIRYMVDVAYDDAERGRFKVSEMVVLS